MKAIFGFEITKFGLFWWVRNFLVDLLGTKILAGLFQC